jgi:DNA-binding transcriptional regulator YdaS (Cro superfamily)
MVYDPVKPTTGGQMTLDQYFCNKPRGAKLALAKQLGISKTWMSLVISGRKVPSPELSHAIERLTGGKVKRATLRPDLFGDIK